MSRPYYQDDLVTLYHGDYADHLEDFSGADAIVTDPPYGETSLVWDRWPSGWPTELARVSNSLWCFGSFRMFMDNLADFKPWKFAQEIVWEKQDGSGFTTDRFRRVHELATHWYQGAWSEVRHETPRVGFSGPNKSVVRAPVGKSQHGDRGASSYVDDGRRLMRSVLRINNTHGHAVHPTQKPLGIVTPLIEYSSPTGGLVVDPFSGSGTTLLAARLIGRRAIGTEANEAYCEAAARRLSQQSFDLEGIA